MQLSEQDKVRFWAKVDVRGEDDCWPWTASLNQGGYGQFNYGGKLKQTKLIASRVAYVLANGSIPDGMHVLHRCDNRVCVNHKHLFAGTHDDNMKDKKAKGRAPRTDGNAKLSFEIAEQIRADKRPYSVLTEVYDVSKSLISYIKNDKIWTQPR
jgi:hypothetical protein